MKSYVITTGSVFALVALAHVARAIEEGSGVLKNPWFVATTILSVGLCAWALRLLKPSR